MNAMSRREHIAGGPKSKERTEVKDRVADKFEPFVRGYFIALYRAVCLSSHVSVSWPTITSRASSTVDSPMPVLADVVSRTYVLG